MIITVCLYNFAGCSKSSENNKSEGKSTSEVSKNKEGKDSKDNKEEIKDKEPVKLKLFLHSRDIQDKSFSKDYIEKSNQYISRSHTGYHKRVGKQIKSYISFR